MTTAEYVKELLDLAMQTHGEDAPVKQLGGGITAARPPTYRNVLQYGVTPFLPGMTEVSGVCQKHCQEGSPAL